MINNKGLTAIELLICFTLVSVIMIAMFQTINNYKSKQDIESFKTQVTTYKTTLTNVIYQDIIDNDGIISVQLTGGDGITDPDDAYKSVDFTYKLTLNFKSGVTRQIEVRNKTRCVSYKRNSSGRREEPVLNQTCQCFDFDANGLCNKTNEFNIDKKNSVFYVMYNGEIFDLPKVDGLRYNSILCEERNDGFFVIHIGLWHNDYGNKYDALNVIVPNINKYPGMF